MSCRIRHRSSPPRTERIGDVEVQWGRLKDDHELREIPVIFMTALDETKDKVHGFEVGAVDFVTKPIQHEEALARVEAHLTIRRLQRELQQANRGLEERVSERTQELTDALAEVKRLKSRLEAENVYLREEIVRCSESMQRVLSKVTQVASTDATVLVLGETGTGKELIARAIHEAGSRKARPLVRPGFAARRNSGCGTVYYRGWGKTTS